MDREKVIAWLADEELYYRNHGDMHNSLMACNALELLKEQEEKTGHWIYESQFADCWSNTCSECGKRFTNPINTFAPYCWNCGAKMEGR